MEGHLTVRSGLAQLPTPAGHRFVELFQHGSLAVELYAPRGADAQKPHTRDELYVVAAGCGRFQLAGEIEAFGPGDALFVPAGVEHRFLDFTDDLAAWVMFYGPESGEANR
jgi:mannose-6-phosphate isomerase-like protein (cupin superfamily)